MTFKLLGLAVLITLMVFILKNDRIRRESQTSYKNDERWQMILIKVNNVTLKFYKLFSLLVVLGYLLGTVVDLNIKVTLSTVLFIIALVLMSSNIVEYFALKYYDKRI
ncbi:hypothetical protein ACE38V_11550 [Cytobacillus sp. Hz8]|uniref:hypothetical protein n=1 Tax=Cytobacillus sp. Hz8 TaxID=3347168 RepID=UPI0035DC5389